MSSPAKINLHGLVAATHTPFDANGAVNLSVVEKQAAHLLAQNVTSVFICGTTAESHSLSLEERRKLAARWIAVTRGMPMRVVIHVGSNCIQDSRELASQAQSLGVSAIASMAPSYFKPGNVEMLIRWCAEVANAAPATPFYFYDIPALTGVRLSMPEFLESAAKRIPTLAGLKFTNPDLMTYQLCLRAQGGFDVLWGMDESLLGALAVGAKGAIGSTYNFAAPIYHRLFNAFESGDLASARLEQYRSVQLVKVLGGYGFMGAAKAVMKMLGVDVGPVRLPLPNLTSDQTTALRVDLEKMGFFDWIQLTGAGESIQSPQTKALI